MKYLRLPNDEIVLQNEASKVFTRVFFLDVAVENSSEDNEDGSVRFGVVSNGLGMLLVCPHTVLLQHSIMFSSILLLIIIILQSVF